MWPGDEFLFDAVDIKTTIRASVKNMILVAMPTAMNYSLCEVFKPTENCLHHGDPEARNWFASQFKELNLPVLDPEPLIEYKV